LQRKQPLISTAVTQRPKPQAVLVRLARQSQYKGEQVVGRVTFQRDDSTRCAPGAIAS